MSKKNNILSSGIEDEVMKGWKEAGQRRSDTAEIVLGTKPEVLKSTSVVEIEKCKEITYVEQVLMYAEDRKYLM